MADPNPPAPPASPAAEDLKALQSSHAALLKASRQAIDDLAWLVADLGSRSDVRAAEKCRDAAEKLEAALARDAALSK